MLAGSVSALLLGTGSTNGALAQGVESATADLAAAVREREASMERLEEATAQHDQIVKEVANRFAGADQLTGDIELAKRQMRRSAVDAFVNADGDDQFFGLLNGEDLTDSSMRATYTSELSLDWTEALESFEAIKRDNDPELIALVERKERLAALLGDAQDAAFQSQATEAEAERALADSRAVANQRAREVNKPADTSPPGTSAPARTDPTSAQPPSSVTTAPPPIAASPTTSAPVTAVVPSSEFSAPLPPLPTAGPDDAQWAALRDCESGGNYQIVSSSGRYRGAYQFSYATWASMGGTGDPAAAPPIEQDGRAKLLFAQRGPRAWPHCGRHLS